MRWWKTGVSFGAKHVDVMQSFAEPIGVVWYRLQNLAGGGGGVAGRHRL